MKHAWSITFVLVILSVLSLFNILSFGVTSDGTLQITDIFVKHSLFIFFGWIIYILFSRIHYSIFKYPHLNILIYLATLLLLIATLIWGPIINNTQRWLIFGEFQFQPSELAKVTIVLFTASLFYFRNKLSDLLVLCFSFLLLVPIIAIVYMQPHGSMSIILLLLWGILVFSSMPNQKRNLILGVIFISSLATILTLSLQIYTFVPIFFVFLILFVVFTYYAQEAWRKLSFVAVLVGIVGGILLSITWHSLLLDYQKERITAFVNPTETSQDLGFNVDQSRVAIGSGQIFGKGWGFGTQSKLHFLPEHQTDFIFAAFSEEFGLIGSLTLIALYSFIIFRILLFSQYYTYMSFEFVFLLGICIKLFLEVFINIGTNVGVIPATGIPLPLMSYGGSSILFFFFSLGLVQSIIGHTFANIQEEGMHKC